MSFSCSIILLALVRMKIHLHSSVAVIPERTIVLAVLQSSPNHHLLKAQLFLPHLDSGNSGLQVPQNCPQVCRSLRLCVCTLFLACLYINPVLLIICVLGSSEIFQYINCPDIVLIFIILEVQFTPLSCALHMVRAGVS